MTTQAYETIIYEPGPITRIVHNEPEKRNAMTTKFIFEFRDALNRFQRNRDAIVGVLLGTGPIFCAGHNLGFVAKEDWTVNKPRPQTESYWRETVDFLRDNLYYPVWDCRKPLVVGVQGGAYAGGAEVAFMCDIVVAGEKSVFDYTVMRITGGGLLWTLLYYSGFRRALAVALTGGRLNAREAEESGLITKVVPDDKVESEAIRYAKMIAAMPPETAKLHKQYVRAVQNMMGARQAIYLGGETDISIHQANWPREKEFYSIMGNQGMRAAIEFRDKPFKELKDS